LYPEPDRLPGDVTLAGKEFRSMATVLEQHMQERQFVVGSVVTVADFVLAYTLDWGNEARLLGHCPKLLAYMEEMYRRPHAPPRIAAALRSIRA
jgi:glutathione S-transferase